jgi:soluble lytic murein transglycosylase-like protein
MLKQNRKKIVIQIIVMLIVICFVGGILLVLGSKTKKLQMRLNEIESILQQTQDQKDENPLFDNSEDLLKKHIEVYIKKRYSKTPKIIAKEISKKVIVLSNQYNISPELLIGMIEIESTFNPFLQSSKGARGLMQVMPEWVPKLGLEDVNDLHEIRIGIESGIKVFLIHLEEADGNISKGLYRYVNGDSSYVEKVYSAVGRFVTYRSVIEQINNNSRKELIKDDSNSKTERNS